MDKPDKKSKYKTVRRQALLTLAFLFFLGLAVYSASQLISGWLDYAASDREYDELRQNYEPPDDDGDGPDDVPAVGGPSEGEDHDPGQAGDGQGQDGDGEVDGDGGDGEQTGDSARPPQPPEPQPGRDPAEINPDYIGWIKIKDSYINYPVVRGQDNEKYLTTSFEGRSSKPGAIFMDYRCADGFGGRHSIVYGHNLRTTSMFGTLNKFLDGEYLENHREMTITLPDGTREKWRIFAARSTDTSDPAYRLRFTGDAEFAAFAAWLGAPEGTARILTLSTCAESASSAQRILVHAAFVE